ncbi:MAG: OmpA family protein [Deltaproteobacteria bacterium]|nr:OmpA family protein [Deltaproteobacteria bacterium]
MFDPSPSFSRYDSKARRQKGFRYLSHQPGDLGMDPAREIGTSNWVFSYADMMNSMVVFLVMLLSFSAFDYQQLRRVSSAVRQASGLKAIPESEQAQTPLDQLEIALESAQIEGVDFDKQQETASLMISEKALFESGHARITDHAKSVMAPVVEKLKSLPAHYRFVIEGHTDDAPIATLEYASNWELSAARALAIVLWMKELGFSEDRLSFQAFGEHRPLVPNRHADGRPIADQQAKNRRAVIKILPISPS